MTKPELVEAAHPRATLLFHGSGIPETNQHRPGLRAASGHQQPATGQRHDRLSEDEERAGQREPHDDFDSERRLS